MKKDLLPVGVKAADSGSNTYRLSARVPGFGCGLSLLAAVALLVGAASPASAQEPSTFRVKPPIPGVVTPPSGIPVAGDKGVHVHTNLRYLTPGSLKPEEAPPFSGLGYETPASLACVYGLVKVQTGCNPNATTLNPTGGSQSIAVVDPYNDPWAPGDLAYFSAQFGIPFKTSQLEVVYVSGFPPPEDYTGGWAFNTASDIEWAHAFAPNAKIYLVEANSDLTSDMMAAVNVASSLVQCGLTSNCPGGSTGKGEVSISWWTEEFEGENANDSNFLAPGVVYVGQTGYFPGTSYPSVSPNVVAVGGSSNVRNWNTGNLLGQRSYDGSGGGLSLYEPRPSYQNSISSLVGSSRGTPDLSFVASPSNYLWVYNNFPIEGVFSEDAWWLVSDVGAAPVAGIINAAGSFASSTSAELTNVYAHIGVPQAFSDIAYGPCGPYQGTFATFGWDQCTGVGTPTGYLGK